MNKRANQRRDKYKVLREAGFSSKEATLFKSRKQSDVDQLIDIKKRSVASKRSESK